jgi:hypothetical protein
MNNRSLALDLRKTLWWWKLGNVLVFEKQKHIDDLRERLRRRNKTVGRSVTRHVAWQFPSALARLRMDGCRCTVKLCLLLLSLWYASPTCRQA